MNSGPQKIFSVEEINMAVRDCIRRTFVDHVWVCGEISDFKDRGAININLVQKHDSDARIVAQANAVIFENMLPRIMRRIKDAGQGFELRKDIEVKLLCKVDLYVKTGKFSLTVVDIEPEYTLGKVAMNRQKIIEDLKRRGLLERNKLLDLPRVPLNIGLITSSAAAGYKDFIAELKGSGYAFNVLLADCFVQGERVEPEVCAALERFNRFFSDRLDVIAIVRGGGSTADLSWFDSKAIAEAIAGSNLPVLTGLGHEIDVTVADLAAHTTQKTPTKSAQFLAERVSAFLRDVDGLGQAVVGQSRDFLVRRRSLLENTAVKIESGVGRYFRAVRAQLVRLEANLVNLAVQSLGKRRKFLTDVQVNLPKLVRGFLTRAQDSLQNLERRRGLLDPRQVLKRGYCLALKSGKAVKSIEQVAAGDVMETLVYDGIITSQITKKEQNHD